MSPDPIFSTQSPALVSPCPIFTMKKAGDCSGDCWSVKWKKPFLHLNHQQSPEQSPAYFIVKIGQGLRRAGDCIVKIGTGLTSQRGYLARGLMRTRIKVFTCSCHANPCTVPYRRGWRQARSFLSPLRPKPSLRRLQPLAARCKGVWGSREWAVLDSLFGIVCLYSAKPGQNISEMFNAFYVTLWPALLQCWK